MVNLAIIPARGGSKRIPRKNIKDFQGKPMIAYSIGAALSSGCFEQVLVSTDDDEVARIARQHGAEVPFRRPPHLADDFTPLRPVANHAINWYSEHRGKPEFVCLILATAPFLDAGTIRDALGTLQESGRDFVFSAASYGYPIQRSFRLRENGQPEWFWPENRTRRSQDLEVAYHDAGQFYWGRTEAFLSGTDVISAHSLVHQLPRHLVHDIDTEEDWERAEVFFRALRSA